MHRLISNINNNNNDNKLFFQYKKEQIRQSKIRHLKK